MPNPSTDTNALEPLNLTVLGNLLEQQQAVLRQHFIQNPGALTREQFCLEMTLIGRIAACEGQYGPAAKFYEMVGKHLGAIDFKHDVHQHVHLHSPGANITDFARQSDDTLRAIVAEAEAARNKKEANV
jgi:hypothetical protein